MSVKRKLIEKTLLECTAGNSNKFYEIEITKVTEKYKQPGLLHTDTRYYVNTRWGKRTKNWQEEGGQNSIRDVHANLNNAKKEASDVIQSKLDKGYIIVKDKKDLKSRDSNLERFLMLDL